MYLNIYDLYFLSFETISGIRFLSHKVPNGYKTLILAFNGRKISSDSNDNLKKGKGTVALKELIM